MEKEGGGEREREEEDNDPRTFLPCPLATLLSLSPTRSETCESESVRVERVTLE